MPHIDPGAQTYLLTSNLLRDGHKYSETLFPDERGQVCGAVSPPKARTSPPSPSGGRAARWLSGHDSLLGGRAGQRGTSQAVTQIQVSLPLGQGGTGAPADAGRSRSFVCAGCTSPSVCFLLSPGREILSSIGSSGPPPRPACAASPAQAHRGSREARGDSVGLSGQASGRTQQSSSSPGRRPEQGSHRGRSDRTALGQRGAWGTRVRGRLGAGGWGHGKACVPERWATATQQPLTRWEEKPVFQIIT